MTIEEILILGAVLELPAKQHCQFSLFTAKMGDIFQETILNLKFKFQAQDSFLEYFFLEIWKTNHSLLKKATF